MQAPSQLSNKPPFVATPATVCPSAPETAILSHKPVQKGTQGATLRIYLERFERDPAQHDLPVRDALAELSVAAGVIAQLTPRTGREGPSLIT